MSIAPDAAAQTALSRDASVAAQAQALAKRAAPGGDPAGPRKPFGKILDSLTPEAAQQKGLDQDTVNTVARQAQTNKLSPGPSEDKKLEKACQEFEAVFIGQLMKEMRKTVPKDGILDGKYQEQYVSMFDEEFSKTMAKQGGMGLARFMMGQMNARAAASKPQPGQQLQGGLRHTASESSAIPAPAQARAGLRGRAFHPLQPDNPLRSNQEIVPAAPSAGPAPVQSLGPSPGQLAGVPSQHLGQPGAAYLTGEDAKLAQLGAGLTAPLAGELTSTFGWRKDPFTGQRAWHSGIDIAAPEGTPVRAAKAGTVEFSGRRGGYGNLVVVEHADGMRTYYGHNRVNQVAQGQSVQAGQILAEVGQTGRATGAHLHFEVRVNQEAVDPTKIGGTMLAAAPDRRNAVPVL